MKPKVYIETSIPSYYHEIRNDPESLSKRQWTKEWWNNQSQGYNLVTAPPVLDELERGNYPTKEDTLKLVAHLPILAVNSEIISIAQEYIRYRVMPDDPAGDALHLAMASYYNCHFLLTWNCRHLANANKVEHIRHMNTLLGLSIPILTTPLQLINEGL